MGFPGAEKIVRQLKEKSWPKQRVGLIAEAGRAPRGSHHSTTKAKKLE